MVGGSNHAHALLKQRIDREARHLHRSIQDKGNVDTAFLYRPAHATHEPPDGTRPNGQPYLRVPLVEESQKPRQTVGEKSLRGTHGERSSDLARTHSRVRDRLPGLLGKAQQPARVAEHDPAHVSQRDPPAQPVEQGSPEFPLQRSYLGAHARLHIAQPRRRPRERKLFRYRPKRLYLPQFHRYHRLSYLASRYVVSKVFVGHDTNTTLRSAPSIDDRKPGRSKGVGEQW